MTLRPRWLVTPWLVLALAACTANPTPYPQNDSEPTGLDDYDTQGPPGADNGPAGGGDAGPGDVVPEPDTPKDTDGCFAERQCEPLSGSCWEPDANLPCGACLTPEPEELCTDDSECEAGFVCGWDPDACFCADEQTCVPACTEQSCAEGEICGADGRCAAAPCGEEADCPAEFGCEEGACQRSACKASADCSETGYCVNGQCFAAPGFCSQPPP